MMFVRDMAGWNQIGAIVVAHGADSAGVVVADGSSVISGGENESVVGRRTVAYVVVVVPVIVRLVPEWTGVLGAYGMQVKRGDEIGGIGNAGAG